MRTDHDEDIHGEVEEALEFDRRQPSRTAGDNERVTARSAEAVAGA